jgi:tetratricopeptide (TPR) repeat protein
MATAKWESLVDVCQRLNAVTQNHFAQQLLPFAIFAQSTLHQGAAVRTQEKRKALEARIQAFEAWKLSSKKKRSRQAMLTGEVPPEEQEFNRDKQQLEREIFRLDVIENVLLADKRTSETLLENIKRDANNCVESLKKCRTLYYQFGLETHDLSVEERKLGKGHYTVAQKRRGYRVFTTMVISNYKKCVDLLRKRQEKFLLIQALHELGNLLYADGNLGEAEICWNDCVDTIFQRLYVVNEWRPLFAANPSLADAFGSRQVIVGGIVLSKLAKLCYESKDMHKYTECLAMAAELFAAPAKLSLPHPLVPSEYTAYRFRDFLSQVWLRDQYILKPSDLLSALAVTAQSLIDQEEYAKCLPLTALMDYVAADVTRSKVLTVKARLLHTIALAEIGYIDEAQALYRRVLELKDLPEHGNFAMSAYSQKQDGKNFEFSASTGYKNDEPPTSESNVAAIKRLLEPIGAESKAKLEEFLSPYLVELV